MKHQYFGDVNDYVKYGLLRAFAAAGFSLGICWMLTPDDGRPDGRKIGYLSAGNTTEVSLRGWANAQQGPQWCRSGHRMCCFCWHCRSTIAHALTRRWVFCAKAGPAALR